MATDHNFRIKNGLEVGGQLIVNSSGQLVVASVSSQLQFSDNVKAKFGNGSDLQIYHDGTDSHIQNTQNNGVLRIRSQETYFLNSDNNETQARFIENGAVTLFYDNAEKFKTHSLGAEVEGQLWINDSNTHIKEGSGDSLRVQTPSGYIDVGPHNTSYAHMGTDRPQFYFNKKIVIGEDILTSYDADLQLQRVNSTKITLTSTGANVTGDLAVSGDLNITGDINSVSVTDLDVVDKTITVGQGQSASNSTGSGLIVSGANASILWHNTNDRWEFNKDIYTSGNIDLGNARIYASGDSNSIHIHAPGAIIGPSTTTTSNPSLGTSAYRWNGVWSSDANFSGSLTFATQNNRNALNMNNNNIIGVNRIDINDPGPNEGINFSGGNIKIYESPDDLTTNSAGNLQIVYGSTRRLTVNNSGIDVNGTISNIDSSFINVNNPSSGAAAASTLRLQAKGNQAGTVRSSHWYLKTEADSVYGNSALVIEKAYDGSSAVQYFKINSSGDATFAGSITATSNANQLILKRTDDTGDDWRFYSWTDGLNIFPSDEASTVWFGRDGGTTDVSIYNGNLKIGADTVIDSSRNLTNIGTISSGAITSSGNVNSSSINSTGTITTGYGLSLTNGNTNFLLYNNTNDNLLYMRDSTNGQMLTTWYTSRFQVDKALRVYGDIQKGSTVVMDSSRNLTNIGTISSGAITTTGKFIQDANGAVNSLEIHDDSASGQPGIYITDAASSPTKEFYAKTYGSSVASTAFGSSITNKSIVATAGSSSAGLLLGTLTADPLIIGTGNAAKITIPASGDITFHSQNLTGIGTISSGAIAATGNVTATANIVASGYVNASTIYSSGNYNILNNGGTGWHNVVTRGNGDNYTVSALGGFNIGNTTVIDSSRNLTNIGFNPNGTNFEIYRDTNSRVIFAYNNNGTREWQVDYNSNGDIDYNRIAGSGAFKIDSNTAWHAGNDGAGSGLDADLLDGQHGSYYARKVYWPDVTTRLGLTVHSLTNLNTQALWSQPAGYQTMIRASQSNGLPTSHGQSYFGYTVTSRRDGGGGYSALLTSYDNSNMYFTYQQNNTAYPTWRKIWHDGNDGSGSGLDADLLDGQQGSYYYSSANPPPTYSKYLRSDTSDSVAAGVTYTWAATDTTGIILPRASGSQEAIHLGGWSTANSTGISRIRTSSNLHIDSPSNGAIYLNNYNPSKSVYMQGGNKAWHAGNDGSGSGLDADMVDSLHASQFVRSDANDTKSGNLVLQTSGAATDTTTGLHFETGGSYTDGRYRTRFRKQDVGGGIPLYIDQSGSTANSYTAQARFGTYSGNNYEFEVYGDMRATGDIAVVGGLTAATKSFDIKHPTKDGMRLHHGVLEGPEHAVYIRGKTKDSTIQLPEYWIGLVHEDTITVQLTSIGKSDYLYVDSIGDNVVNISNDTEYFYFIQAERKDIERFEVEYGNSL
jgi:hypothetical protein